MRQIHPRETMNEDTAQAAAQRIVDLNDEEMNDLKEYMDIIMGDRCNREEYEECRSGIAELLMGYEGQSIVVPGEA